jgi:large subunit ribosomal protein L25
MSEQLRVERRLQHGKRSNRHLRAEGRLPAVLYGHGEEAVSLALSAEEVDAAIRHGSKVVELQGAAAGKALVHDVQWDTFFQHVLHVDLLRVHAGEKVTVDVPIELRGDAPGAREGGAVEQLIHSVEIEVPLDAVPDKLHLNINHLEVDGTLTIGDIEDLPPSARVLAELDEVVVHCILRGVEMEEEAVEAAEAAEPEVIGKGKEEEEEEGAEEK